MGFNSGFKGLNNACRKAIQWAFACNNWKWIPKMSLAAAAGAWRKFLGKPPETKYRGKTCLFRKMYYNFSIFCKNIFLCDVTVHIAHTITTTVNSTEQRLPIMYSTPHVTSKRWTTFAHTSTSTTHHVALHWEVICNVIIFK